MPCNDRCFYIFVAHASCLLINAPHLVSRTVAAILTFAHIYLSTQQSCQQHSFESIQHSTHTHNTNPSYHFFPPTPPSLKSPPLRSLSNRSSNSLCALARSPSLSPPKVKSSLPDVALRSCWL